MEPIKYRVFNPGTINSPEFMNPSSWLQSKVTPFSEDMVSALMVTRGDIGRVANSVKSFARQTWNNKELVIVADGLTDQLIRAIDDARGAASVRIFEAPRLLGLGDLRNYSVARAQGEFICQWDDDDLYDKERIKASLMILKEANADAVFLSQWLLYDQLRSVLALSNRRIWEGTMLAKRSCMPVYPSLPKEEDTLMVAMQLKYAKVATFVAPTLYAYCRTGANTWGDAYFSRLFDLSEKVFSNEEALKILARLTVN